MRFGEYVDYGPDKNCLSFGSVMVRAIVKW